jgi:hypothetical protein
MGIAILVCVIVAAVAGGSATILKAVDSHQKTEKNKKK